METSSSLTQLNKKRDQYRAQLAKALEEDADPLAAYHDFVKWTTDSYPSKYLAQSGLLELLEEATRQFKDDAAYKGDLRYLRLWLLYASHVEDPTIIHAFLNTNDIGTVYAQTYQEYANALERNGRRAEADAIYRKGIQQRARPVDPLKRRYEEFKGRSSAPSQPNSSASLWSNAPSQTQSLRRNPLKNYPGVSVPSASGSAAASTPPSAIASKHGHDRYAPMLAPPAPGKRPEKLRFNLALLFTEDGTEYSMQEARARSMGLLGKKWGPPPAPARTVRLAAGGGATRGRTLAEPTVTLATKEALADVFGMYNSPEKSMRFGAVAPLGSKHAPVRRVEPVTPLPALAGQLRAVSNENAGIPARTPGGGGFQPFVDENAQAPKSTARTPSGGFQPFIDDSGKPLKNKSLDLEQPSRLPTLTPSSSRRALAPKEPVSKPPTDENAHASRSAPTFRPFTDDAPKPVFSAVFTPQPPPQARPAARRDVFIDGAQQLPDKEPPPTVFRVEPAPAKIVPFVDQQPARVFSRPPPRNENPAPPLMQPPSVFKPYVDPAAQAAAKPPARTVLGERTPFRPFTPQLRPPPVPEPEPEFVEAPLEDDISASDEESYAEFAEEGVEFAPPPPEEDSLYEDGDLDGDLQSPAAAPLGGRFGQFGVMTPIAERTMEYTSSTRAANTPVGAPPLVVFRDADAVEAAEQLAAELRADEDGAEEAELEDSVAEVEEVEERTGTLNLEDALDVASTFRPPNPCNPFDPPIVSTLLSLLPQERDFHDLRHTEANQLEPLQKFAKKRARRASANSSSRSLDESDTLKVHLAERNFAVVDKLGEGGFGAVFEAKDLDMVSRDPDEDEDEDDDDDLDEKSKVAVKVVKPRNLWEFHVLRSIHRTLPPHLRHSIVFPQALYAFRDESFLVLELCKQGTLLDIVNRAGAAGITQQGACLDELLVVFFAIELLRMVEGLHRAGFIHGDVKIDNCLLRLEDVPGPASAWAAMYDPSGGGGWRHKGIKMIDFGRAIDTRLFPASQRYVAEWPTDARDCLEMRAGRPWTYQTDYFGLAGILFCLLYGKYIEAASVVPVAAPGAGAERYKLSVPFKRYWQVDLWTRLFDLLLNPSLVRPDGHLPLCDELADLRGEMETWLQANCNRASNSLKGLLKKIGIAILGGKDGR